MIISNFNIRPCPKTTEIIRELIRSRKLKEMVSNVQKPQFIQTVEDYHRPKPKQFVIEKSVTLRNEIKKKIYKRNSSNKITKQYKLLNKYNVFLLHYLHKTSWLEHIRNSPIQMSVLDTKNQPAYPFNYEEKAYKKQYPHYSNIIQLNKLPVEEKAPIFLLPTKMKTSSFKDVYATTCVTLYQVIQFCFKFLLGEDITFQNAAIKLMMTDRNVKLMYEVVDHVFQLDYLCDKLAGFRSKERMNASYQKYCKKIKDSINEAFKDKQCSQFIPRNQIRISLKELHQRLNSIVGF